MRIETIVSIVSKTIRETIKSNYRSNRSLYLFDQHKRLNEVVNELNIVL